MPPSQVPISILLPVYNDGHYLVRAVRSLQRQTLACWELLLLDDGSRDGTGELAESLQQGDGRIRVFHFPHRGIAGTLNEGLSRARGRYVARMDADDISHVRRLALQKDFLDRRADLCAVGSLVRVFPRAGMTAGMLAYEGWVNSLVRPDEIAREIFVDAPLVHPSVMIRRRDLEAVGGYGLEGPEDFDLWLRLHLKGMRFAKVPSILLFWMDRQERATRCSPAYRKQAFRKCRAVHLARWIGGGREVLLAGKKEAKRLGSLLEEQGLRVAAYVDLDPKTIGARRRGMPIISYESLAGGKLGAARLILAAVGTRGAREEIRGRLRGLGYREIEDFLCVA
ncbi:MAG: glycosyltransferase family 2 protein [bacterium]